jgi:hypothetical protein
MLPICLILSNCVFPLHEFTTTFAAGRALGVRASHAQATPVQTVLVAIVTQPAQTKSVT